MKTSPSVSKPTLYHVTINGDSFDTMASNPQSAISKCAYKYAVKNGDQVALVQWKIRNGELRVKVKEGEK
jgi:hypothetical protein